MACRLCRVAATFSIFIWRGVCRCIQKGDKQIPVTVRQSSHGLFFKHAPGRPHEGRNGKIACRLAQPLSRLVNELLELRRRSKIEPGMALEKAHSVSSLSYFHSLLSPISEGGPTQVSVAESDCASPPCSLASPIGRSPASTIDDRGFTDVCLASPI